MVATDPDNACLQQALAYSYLMLPNSMTVAATHAKMAWELDPGLTERFR